MKIEKVEIGDLFSITISEFALVVFIDYVKEKIGYVNVNCETGALRTIYMTNSYVDYRPFNNSYVRIGSNIMDIAA